MHKSACPQNLSECARKGILREDTCSLLKELQAAIGEMGDTVQTAV